MKATIEARSMALSVYEPGRPSANFRRPKICRSQDSLMHRRPINSESDQRVAKMRAMTRLKKNLRQASCGPKVRGDPARHCGSRQRSGFGVSRRLSLDQTLEKIR